VFLGIGAVAGQTDLAMVALVAVAVGALLMPSARCTKCGHRWSADPEAQDEAPLPDARDTVERACPRCGSFEVYQIDQRRLKAWPLLFNASIFFVVPMWLVSAKRRCDSCGLEMR